jgi:indole-3-glycerol phosphate synthase
VTSATDSFLDGMVVRRREDIAARFGEMVPADRERLVCSGRAVRDFVGALSSRKDVAVIAEVKKASPSAGVIARDIEASKQALHYQAGGAAAVSVLTEPSDFGGSFTDLSDVEDAVDVPVLCKDFVVDPVQLFVARGHGADAVLLMVSVLGARTGEYLDLAHTLGMEGLVEVVDEVELEVARAAGARFVAVNSRDLHTLRVDREAAYQTVRSARGLGMTTVAASGVTTRDDVMRAAAAGADAVLVGERLMRAAFPEDILAELTGVTRTGG